MAALDASETTGGCGHSGADELLQRIGMDWTLLTAGKPQPLRAEELPGGICCQTAALHASKRTEGCGHRGAAQLPRKSLYAFEGRQPAALEAS